MKPNFFLVGAPKCGTTAIAEYLATRDDVFFSKPKEPLMWCDDLGNEPHALRVANLVEYEALFAGADPDRHRVVAEGTTAYLRSRRAIQKANAYNPEARFAAILRNPVEVAHAYHMEQVYCGLERETDFAAAWADQERRETEWDAVGNRRPDSLLYRRIASFAGQIERFFTAIPSERRLVLIYDDFRANPRSTYLELLDFLGLPDDRRTDFPPRNVAHAQRFPRLSRFLLAPPPLIASPIKSLRMVLLRHETRLIKRIKGVLNVKRPRTALDLEVRARMTEMFRSDVERLETLLKRDLSAWKKERP